MSGVRRSTRRPALSSIAVSGSLPEVEKENVVPQNLTKLETNNTGPPKK